MKHENMSWEILDAIKDTYYSNTKNSKELIRDCLLYLKEINNSNDKKLDYQIEDWLKENNFCINCGEELQAYDWYERHTELDGNIVENFTTMYCPYCDKYYY